MNNNIGVTTQHAKWIYNTVTKKIRCCSYPLHSLTDTLPSENLWRETNGKERILCKTRNPWYYIFDMWSYHWEERYYFWYFKELEEAMFHINEAKKKVDNDSNIR